MSRVKIIKVADIGDVKLEQYENCSDTLFITATRSLTYQTKKDNEYSVYDVTQLDNIIRAELKNRDCLKESEMRYLLHKAILNISDDKKKTAFINSESGLYELYNNLLLAELNPNDIDIAKIYKSKLISYADIFQLFIDYCKIISSQKRVTYQSAYNVCLQEIVKPYKKVSLVGFSFFKDVINNLLKYLIKEDKLSSFITNDDFIIEDLIQPLLDDNKVKYDVIKTKDCFISRFDDLRKNLVSKNKIDNAISDNIFFYKPFFTREDEFKFVISQIIKQLKECSTIEEINSKCERLAIIVVSQFAKQTQTFNDLFKRQGVFIAPNKQIFYSQDEFLNSNYKSNLTKKQRLQLFSEFQRLEVYEPPKTLFNSTLGKFVCEIYKIAGNGMKLHNFNTLIHINWLFKETQIQDIIGEFNKIKDFFENLETIDEWEKQIKKLLELKRNLNFKQELHNHPIKSIREETLLFIGKYIVFLRNVIMKIQNENGSIKNHIKTLVEAVKSEYVDETLEKELLQEFGAILSSKDDGVNIDNQYFAQNFQSLISEYLSAKNIKSNNIRVNVINMESANSYDIVFVPMFEENKYPMEYKYEFPYSMGVIDILKDKELIKNYRIPLNITQDHSLKMAKHIFENLFRIAREKIIFTRTESENGMPIDMSIFGYDILSKLDNLELKEVEKNEVLKSNKEFDERIFKKHKLKDMYLNEMLGYFVCPKMFYYSNILQEESCYSDKFLLNFYCKGLIYNRVLSYVANGNTYTEKTLRNEIEKEFDTISSQVFDILPLFDENNKNDIRLSAKNLIYNFVNEKIFTGRYKPTNEFTLTLSSEKVITHKSVNVITYRNLVVTDVKKGISCEFDISKSLDTLISSTGKRQTTKKHFWDIIAELQSELPIDRANSLNFLSFKLNTQLNTPKYKEDGIARTKEVIEYIKEEEQGNLGLRQSSYCSFCKYKNVCMGAVDYD